MIRLEKGINPPKILLENAENWTNELIDAVNEHGGYSKIPSDIKEKIIKNYRNYEIKQKLIESSHGKCAFCESIPSESGNIEVEHFKPKSIYYNLTFDWDNLLPVCRKCNEAKSDFDTGTNPIVNPARQNPETIFTYNMLSIKSINVNDDISKRTIEVCNLNSPRLFKVRADLLINLSSYEQSLKDWLQEIEESETEFKRSNRIKKLKNSLELIENLTNSCEKYAGYCRWYLNNSEIYQCAKDYIEEH